MILLTRFDGAKFYINIDFIEFIEETPDTMLSLIDHKRILVRESANDVVGKITEYLRSIYRGNTGSGGRIAMITQNQAQAEHSEKEWQTEHLRDAKGEGA